MEAPRSQGGGPVREERSRRRHPWRENLETLSVAVVLALTLKVYAVEAYKIPTGSMQPTLMGSDEAGIYDRILVDKLVYHFRDPRRWEIVVFRFPLDLSKNYIKRIVGVGPEWIRIENGDLYRRETEKDEWEILRKPRAVQEEVWKRVYRGPIEGEDPFVSWRKESGRWVADGERIRTQGEGRLRFSPRRGDSIRDVYTDGYPASVATMVARRSRPERWDVPDLRVSSRVRAGGDFAGLRLAIAAGHDQFEASFPGPAAKEPRGFLRRSGPGDGGGREIPLEGVRLEAGREVRVSLAHVDGAAEAEIDGRSFRMEWPEDPDRDAGRGNRVTIVAEGGEATLRDLRVERDIYYTKDGGVTTDRIPAGRYFMMGDNTQNSADSRAWESISLTIDDPVEGRRTLRGNHRSNDPNYAEANPKEVPRPDDFVHLFTDDLGETWRYDPGKVADRTRVPEPFVRREHVLGRALVVFWPLPPLSPVLRWRLVR